MMKNDYTISLENKVKKRVSGVSGKILVGFSGGADSTVLLTVLCKIFGCDALCAVHINHMLRGADADRDEAFCREYCKKLGVKFFARKIDVNALCGGVAVEETARNVRYGVFSELSEKENIKYIALAHTQSDNFETVLFNICRGCGLAGLRGIPFSRPCGSAEIVRPLLDCTKEEILGYAGENGLDFVTDKTNADTHYTRNFIRAEIVPKIKEIFPRAETAAGKMSELTALDEDYLALSAENFIKQNAAGGKIKTEILCAAHPAIVHRAIALLFGKSLEADRIADAEDIIRAGKDTSLSVSGGIFATVKDGEFFFEEKQTSLPRPEFDMPLAEGINISPLGFAVVVGAGIAPDDYFPAGECDIPAECLAGLHARSRRAGDKYRFWKMTRTIKKMIGSFPESTKKIRPVICDGDKIVWYPGFPAADFGAWKERTVKIKYYEKNFEVNENAEK